MELMFDNLDKIRTDTWLSNGENNKKIIKYGRNFTVYELLKICYDLTLGLHFLHHRNIIHRDISTNNILVDLKDNRVSRVLISDFGQSRHCPMSESVDGKMSAAYIESELNGLTVPSYLGKIHFRPPEGLFYVFEYNKLWDIWQMGEVFLTLISSSRFDHPYAKFLNKK